MRPLPRALLAAALLVAAASSVPAQGALTFTLSLDPPSRQVEPGNATATDVVVENLGVTALRVDLSLGPTPLGATLARTNLSVAGGATERVRLNVTTAGLSPGNYSVEVFAREPAGTPPMQPQSAAATLTVRVAAPPPSNATKPGGVPSPTGRDNGTGEPDPVADGAGGEGDDGGNATNLTVPDAVPLAPVLSVERLAVEAAPRQVVPFRLEVENPGEGDETFDVTLRLPVGWTGSLERERVDVPRHGRAQVQGSLMPLADAADGEALLAVRGPGGSDSAVLALRVLPAAPPGTDGGDADNASAQETPPVSGPDGTAAASPPPPPPPGVVALRLDPAAVRIPHGGSALVRLVVANGGGEAFEADPRLLLPQGFLVDPGAPRVLAPPGQTVEVPLVLRASDGLAVGSEGRGTASLAGVDADAAPFSLLVVEPDPGEPAAPAADASSSWPFALALGAAGAAALASAWAWRRRWHLGLFALYARLKPGRVLEHPTRRAIADLVAAEPGVRLGEARRRLGLANGRLRHHVDRLESAGVLRSVPEGPHRRLYPSAMGRVAPLPGLAERILLALQERGPLGAAGLAADLGVSRQALHYHVKKLAADGRIATRRTSQELVLSVPRVEAHAADAPRGASTGPAR